eukprot:TRINITY_DN61090_c0_g1_i1.p1 TRINITY_DN61090_c0_g1~~TRINITY_DN61090_c0_g1_i1.p1  ORF type:complete len:312 (-),score=43.01 TRINITY_DN61090_c0_g1_i1:73-1008(-)
MVLKVAAAITWLCFAALRLPDWATRLPWSLWWCVPCLTALHQLRIQPAPHSSPRSLSRLVQRYCWLRGSQSKGHWMLGVEASSYQASLLYKGGRRGWTRYSEDASNPERAGWSFPFDQSTFKLRAHHTAGLLFLLFSWFQKMHIARSFSVARRPSGRALKVHRVLGRAVVVCSTLAGIKAFELATPFDGHTPLYGTSVLFTFWSTLWVISGPMALAYARAKQWAEHRKWADTCVLNGLLFMTGRLVMALLYSVAAQSTLYFWAMSAVSVVAVIRAVSNHTRFHTLALEASFLQRWRNVATGSRAIEGNQGD